MIRSKYIGQKFGNWEVTEIRIRNRYGKRLKKKGNTYCYILTRETSDNKAVKSITVSHTEMSALGKGTVGIQDVVNKQDKRKSKFVNSASYRFLS